MKRFFVTTIDSEYDTLKKATVNIKSYIRRGRSGRQTYVSGYTQQRLMREDATKLLTGGFSWRAWGKEEPKTGFMVGIKHGSISKGGDLYDWFKKEANFVKQNPNRFYGGWIDHDTSKIYMDISLNIFDKVEALRRAEGRKEISIWDVAKKSEIKV
jgi:hypothetical protein